MIGHCREHPQGELLLPTAWDVSPSRAYPWQYIDGTHVYNWVKRDKNDPSKLSFLRNNSTVRHELRPPDLKFEVPKNSVTRPQ